VRRREMKTFAKTAFCSLVGLVIIHTFFFISYLAYLLVFGIILSIPALAFIVKIFFYATTHGMVLLPITVIVGICGSSIGGTLLEKICRSDDKVFELSKKISGLLCAVCWAVILVFALITKIKIGPIPLGFIAAGLHMAFSD